MSEKRWIPETLFDELGFRMTYAVEKVLHEDKTEHQHLVLFEHKHFGKMLLLDGATQVTTRDEFIYHEMMAHVPILAHGEAREILIIGGGDCGIAEEVLKHASVQRLTQVEIDPSVVEFSKQHFPEFTGPVFSDRRFDLVIDDGMKYAAQTDRRFDVIIVDSTDPQGPGAVLFTRDFYAACRRCMHPGGVMVTQNGVPFLQPDELIGSVRHLRSLFADAACYVAAACSARCSRGALRAGRSLRDQILDTGGPRCRVRAAALHRRVSRGRRRIISAPVNRLHSLNN
jgi:spermidine synthase